MKPIIFPQTFLENKVQRKWQIQDKRSKFVCLTKYFPKYYKTLALYDDPLKKCIQFKIKQLKIINEFWCNGVSNYKKSFRKLFLSSRKTLKNLPSSDGDQDLNQCLFFPNLKIIDLEGHRSYFFKKNSDWPNFRDEDTDDFKWITGFYWNILKKSYGYFWAGNRSVESLKIVCETDVQLIIIKILNDLKKFFSSLKILELTFYWNNYNGSNVAIQLVKNRNFLQHVKHLRIKNSGNFCIDWESLQAFIKCFPQLSFLSFPTHKKESDQDLSLDLNCFPKLRVLEIDVYDLEALIKRVEFSPDIREVSLAFSRDTCNSFKRILARRDINDDEIPQIEEILEYVDDENGEVQEISQWHGVNYESEETKEWEGFDQHKMLGSFFEKWKQLKDLKVLSLNLWNISNMNIMIKTFLIPLLREISQLETLKCGFYFDYGASKEDRLFDLDVFLEGIKSLKSLKNLSISRDLVVLFSPEKSLFLTSLSSLDISARSLIKFNVSKFFRGLFHNLELRSKNEEKTIRLSKVRLRCAKEMIKLYNFLDQASQFKNLQIDIEDDLFPES